jgi:hypothetical protein
MPPDWCIQLLREGAQRLEPLTAGAGSRPVFPAPLGGWRDPSNTQSDLRDAFTASGFDGVTTHVFRQTVATLMDDAGLSARAAADQLGHATTSMTTDVHFGRKIAPPAPPLSWNHSTLARVASLPRHRLPSRRALSRQWSTPPRPTCDSILKLSATVGARRRTRPDGASLTTKR